MTGPATFSWPNGQSCAVTLTYDDSLPVHHQMVAPLLEGQGLRATFNVCASQNLTDFTDEWKKVAAAGHELGNHTLFHPCRRTPPERFTWLAPCYDLSDYTPERWTTEMRVGNCLLRLIDGRTERTFGNTCCDTTIGRGDQETSLDPLILQLFVAGRGACDGSIVNPSKANLAALGHGDGDRRTFEYLRKEIQRAVECRGWIIFMFHGVGAGTHHGYIEVDEHAALVRYLANNSAQIWTSSMVDVAKHVKQAGAH